MGERAEASGILKCWRVSQMNGMDKTIRKYTNFDEMKADEYRYWQSRPVHERVQAGTGRTVPEEPSRTPRPYVILKYYSRKRRLEF